MSAPVASLPPLAPALDDRDAILAELETVHAWLSSHPSIPVSSVNVDRRGASTVYKFCGTPAEVDRIAAHLGIAARWMSETRYMAELPLGLYRRYQAVCTVTAQDQDPEGSVHEMARAS